MPVTADGTESTERVSQATLICSWQVDLHVACLSVPVLFAWNLCIQTRPHNIHLVPETEWITPVRSGHSLARALPGFPTRRGRLGCTLSGGTCACQMLFSLSFPNLPISLFFCFFVLFPANKNKSLSVPEKQVTFLFSCVGVIST